MKFMIIDWKICPKYDFTFIPSLRNMYFGNTMVLHGPPLGGGGPFAQRAKAPFWIYKERASGTPLLASKFSIKMFIDIQVLLLY